MSKEYIICGFSGVGKSTAEYKQKDIVDMESSGFSHVWRNGFYGWGKNPEFPSNYIDRLCELIDNHAFTYYLMSCHQEVREELKARGLDYIIVMPTIEQKNEYLKRWLKRGSPIEFIKLMNNKWEDMIKSCEEDDAPKIYLSSGEYISDLICLL